MKETYEFPQVEEITVSPMRSLLQNEVTSPSGEIGGAENGGDD